MIELSPEQTEFIAKMRANLEKIRERGDAADKLCLFVLATFLREAANMIETGIAYQQRARSILREETEKTSKGLFDNERTPSKSAKAPRPKART